MRGVFLVSKDLGFRVLQKALEIGGRDSIAGVVIVEDGADRRSRYNETVRLCNDQPLTWWTDAQPKECYEEMVRTKADFLFVSGYYRIIPDEVIAKFPEGSYGIHHSLLPRYRGGSPLVWALIRGDRVAGSSLFRLDGGIDSGPIVSQRKFEVPSNWTIADATKRADDEALDMFRLFFNNFRLHGTVHMTAQEEKDATYAAQRTDEDGQISWEWPSDQVHDFVRAQTHPYPGAWTLDDKDRKLRVLSGAPVRDAWAARPGQVVRHSTEFVDVATGEGWAYRILRACYEGEGDPEGVPRALQSRSRRLR